MQVLKKTFLHLILISCFIIINCSTKESGGTIETTNGAISGIIVDTISDKMGLSAVTLIPFDFNPALDDESFIIRDTIDGNGKFEFKNLIANKYNIEIHSLENNLKAFYKEIEVDDSEKDIDTIKLNFTGSFLLDSIPDSLSSNGIFYFEGSTFKWPYKSVVTNNAGIFSNLPSSILPSMRFIDPNNKTTILTNNINIIPSDTINVEIFFFYIEANTSNSSLPSDNISTLSFDKMGFVWIGTVDSGFTEYSSIDWTVSKVGFGSVLLTNSITDIESFVDLNNDTISWVGTTNGLVKKSGRNQESLVKIADTLLVSNNVRCVTYGRLNGIWVGTDSGLVYFNGTTWKKSIPSLTSNDIQHCELDIRNYIWVGNNSGTSKFDGASWTFIKSKPVASISFIKSLEELWLAHSDGTISISKDGAAPGETRTSGYSIQTIFEASDGKIYLGTSEGLQIYSSGKFSDLNPGNFAKLKDHSITSITEDKNRNLWFGTENSGLIILGPTALEISFPNE